MSPLEISLDDAISAFIFTFLKIKCAALCAVSRGYYTTLYKNVNHFLSPDASRYFTSYLLQRAAHFAFHGDDDDDLAAREIRKSGC